MLPYEVVSTQNVANELNSSTGRKVGSDQFLCRANANALVSIVMPNESEYRLYIDLTSPESSRLVDVGEASVVALSKLRYLHGECIPVILDQHVTIPKIVQGGIGFQLAIFF